MDRYNDLIQRLRAGIVIHKVTTPSASGLTPDFKATTALMSEAADHLTALERERDGARAPSGDTAAALSADLSKTQHELDDVDRKLTAYQAEVERLKEDCDSYKASMKQYFEDTVRLKEALKPFAEAADSIDDTDGDHIEMWEHPASMQVTAADFRRARSEVRK